MKIGFYSPLPPARTGVADYSSALLTALAGLADVAINSAGDINLYHAGNNGMHSSIYDRALAEPGVVVLHDAVLNHFLLGRLSEEEYVREFCFNYGEAMRGLARQLWRERARSAADERYFRYPMIRRICERARRVIVHNAGAAAIVRRHAPGADVRIVPHLFAGVPESASAARDALRVPHDAFLLGLFGHLRATKRVHALLRVFERVHRELPRVYLLIAGDCVGPDLERALTAWSAHPGIRRTGYLDAAAFWSHARAVDACVNLRYPAAGETSGITIRLMGIGKCVLVTDGLEVDDLPAAACVRVPHGADEEPALAGMIRWLAAAPGDARSIGARAYDYIRVHHAPQRVARLYLEALATC